MYFLRVGITGLILLGSAFVNLLLAQVAQINAGRFQIDAENRLIICNQLPAKSATAYTSIQFNDLFTFREPVAECRLSERYEVRRNDVTYSLYFTKFPLIAIDTRGEAITRESVTSASWSLIDTLGNYGSSAIGINVRGAFSKGVLLHTRRLAFRQRGERQRRSGWRYGQ